MKIITIHI